MRLCTPNRAKPRRIATVGLLAIAAGTLALAGCGSSSSSTTFRAATIPLPGSKPSTTNTFVRMPTFSLAANPEGQLKYDKTSLNVNVTGEEFAIDFTNMSPISHNVTVAYQSGRVIDSTSTFQGGSQRLVLELRPGTYKFYCSVIGHRKAGMEGTLTVH